MNMMVKKRKILKKMIFYIKEIQPSQKEEVKQNKKIKIKIIFFLFNYFYGYIILII